MPKEMIPLHKPIIALKLLDKRYLCLLVSILFIQSSSVLGQKTGAYQAPVNPNASAEAKELLRMLYDYSGKYVLSGQHNYIGDESKHSEETEEITGEYPVVWGSDFGFADSTNAKDAVYHRHALVAEVNERFKTGNIITLMWHACRPTDEEPCTWKGSVQNELSEDEWNDLIRPGTRTYQNWANQVDEIAVYLKQLELAGIPVLWRPYHEMNGDWFWWGQKPGENGYRQLWKNLYHRLTDYHQLNNLIWVWNANATLARNKMAYDLYYPGNDYVDILATDIYGGNYKKSDHDQLLELGNGKPIAMGEVGAFPNTDLFEEQPYWVWFMSWSNSTNNRNPVEKVKEMYTPEKILGLEDFKELKK
ncbi:glycosyl hydrolase [Cyclobacterium jeungdonense]|uniref:Glycosyl hydrolase n=2 Tax=Cyclobacterium jeungdonense TaxID=708087 RepID=A0ABT8C6G5_9BACT|nr:glycosyl hydrolase [Cyclobacterium jeungdonense]